MQAMQGRQKEHTDPTKRGDGMGEETGGLIGIVIYSPVFGLILNFPCSFPDRMRYVISAFVPISLLVAKTERTWVPREVSSGTVTR